MIPEGERITTIPEEGLITQDDDRRGTPIMTTPDVDLHILLMSVIINP